MILGDLDMTLLQLELFIAVCEERSFTKAAEKLHMTQSAVSQAISNLETELCVRLLQRHRHGVTLTAIGDRVLSHARSVIQHTFEIREESLAASGADNGTLRIGTVQSVGAHFLAGLLGAFRAHHRHVQVTLLEGTSDEVNNWLRNHHIDVALTVLPTEGFSTLPLLMDEFFLYVPTAHRLSKSASAELHQLADDDYVQLKGTSPVISEAFKLSGVTPKVRFELGESSAILELVEAGLGVTILPQLAVPTRLPGVVRVALHRPLVRDIGLAVRDMNRVSPACADFILHAKEYAAGGNS